MPIIKNTPNWDDIQNKPSTFPPDTHASNHANGGSDEITPADIEAIAQIADYDSGWFSVTNNTLYTLDHNFGKLPSNIIVLYRQDSTHTTYGIQQFYYTSSQRGSAFAVNSSSIKIHTGQASDSYINSPLADLMGAASSTSTSGELRVLAWK